MSKWLVGVLCLTVGVLVGGGGVYLWLKQVGPAQNSSSIVPAAEPSESDGHKLLQTLLADAGVQAQVHAFHATNWHRYEGIAEHMTGIPSFEMNYEAEVEFTGPCHLKENWTLT